MENHLEDIVRKLKCLLWGSPDKSQQKALQEELKAAHCEEIYKKLSNPIFIVGKLEEYEGWQEREAFRKFVKIVGRKRQARIGRWLGAVAGIACLLGLVIFLQTRPKENTGEQVKVAEQVIAPGSPKAILKLASGEKINITSDSQQVIENDGSRIIYEKGKLNYQARQKTNILSYNELEVPAAGECYITLDDGTRVWVNAASRLRYPVQFSGEKRQVYLEGEAYFDVTKGEKPFIVSTAKGDVQVLGTVFNIKSYQEEEMQTTLVEGKVRLSANQQMAELLPGEQGVVNRRGEVSKHQVDIQEYIGWQTGVYLFRKQSLATISKDLERWYDVSIVFQTEDLKKIAFTGNLKRYDNINVFMELLARTGDVKYKIDGSTVILYK